jgi:hypothetical protein
MACFFASVVSFDTPASGSAILLARSLRGTGVARISGSFRCAEYAEGMCHAMCAICAMRVDCVPTFTLVEHQRGDRTWEVDSFGYLSVRPEAEMSIYI